jgi:hypothetical protein
MPGREIRRLQNEDVQRWAGRVSSPREELAKGHVSVREYLIHLAFPTDIISSIIRTGRAGRCHTSFNHSLPAVGPRYLDRPLFPSIRVPYEPFWLSSSIGSWAGLLEALVPVLMLYDDSSILADRDEPRV